MTLHEAMRRLHPATEPSDALTQRVAALAAEAKHRPNPARLPVAFAAGSAVAALATIAFFTLPKATVAHTMETAYSNLQKVSGLHYRLIFTPKSNAQTFIYEVWRSGAAWRQDVTAAGKTSSQIIANGLIWNVNPQQKLASYQKASPASLPTFDAETTQKQIAAALQDKRGTNLGTVTWNGRSVQKIAVPGPVHRFIFNAAEPGRSVFWIDTERLLPVRIEGQVREPSDWRTVMTVEYDPASSVSPVAFQLPPGTETYSMAAVGARAGAPFAKPLAQKRFASRTIALRDVQVNREGDIFVLYTDGSTPTNYRESYPSTIRDDKGTAYAGTAGGITPFMFCSDVASNRGLIVDGQAVTGVCVVPATPPRDPWTPRKISVEIHFVEYVGKKAYTRTARFTVPVAKPRAQLLPTYARDLAKLELAGGDPKRFVEDRELGRQSYFFNERDWQGLLRCTDHAITLGIAGTNAFLWRATAYSHLGERAKAQEALMRAEQEDTFGFAAAQIQSARKELDETPTRPR